MFISIHFRCVDGSDFKSIDFNFLEAKAICKEGVFLGIPEKSLFNSVVIEMNLDDIQETYSIQDANQFHSSELRKRIVNIVSMIIDNQTKRTEQELERQIWAEDV